jgi:LemA protein
MTKSASRFALVFAGLLTSSLLAGCGMQAIPQSKNNVEAAFAEVSNQYKRRADLVPNLVGVVKGYAKHEQETLTAVIEARSKATQITVDPTNLTPEKLKQFQSAQSGMSQALGRLMVVSEQYPNLKADSQFRDLQAQLEGTENRITVARQRYIQAVQEFNNIVTVPPTSWTNSVMYHFEKMPQWEVAEDEKGKVEKPPQVSF